MTSHLPASSRAGSSGPRFGVKLASHYLSIDEILRLAVRAESHGFSSVWTTEGRMAPDSVTLTAAIAARTERVRLGTSVLNPFSRTPGLVAITAASIDQISHGRFILGIGAGDPLSLAKQNISHDRPVTRLTEYVDVIRKLWAGGTVNYRGTTLHVSDLAMDFSPFQRSLPIYVAATGPRALRRANQIGDGILLNIINRETATKIAETVDRQRDVQVIGTIVVAMHHDRAMAVRGVKPLVVNYLTRFPAIAAVSRLSDSLLDTLRAARARGMEEACAVLPDEHVHQFAAVGDPEECRRWIRDYAAGLDEVLLTPAYGDADVIVDELAGLLH